MTSLATSQRLTASDFTFAFNCIGEVPLAERIAVARAAGFVEIGLSCRWMSLWLVDHDLSELEEALATSGMRVGELEAIRVMREEQKPLDAQRALRIESLFK